MKITAVPVALGDRPGQMALTVDLESSNHLVESNLDRPTELVQVMRLDEYLAQHPSLNISFMKIDAEGFDLQVLKGAEHLLKIQRPELMVETWGPPTVRMWLEDRGYRIYRYAVEAGTLHEYPRPFGRPANVLAVHDEKVQYVRERLINSPTYSFALPRIEWSSLGGVRGGSWFHVLQDREMYSAL
jgi:hypothetical protein